MTRVLPLLLLAASCTAEPAYAGVIEKIGPERFALHSVAAAADVATTWRCSRRRTCEEANPALRAIIGKRMNGKEAVASFIAMEAIYVSGSILIGETAGYDSRLLDIFQLSSIGAHGLAATLNMRF